MTIDTSTEAVKAVSILVRMSDPTTKEPK